MKILLFLTLIGFVVSAPAINQDIQNDIQDFMEVIPVEKIKKIAIQHLHDDPEFQAAVKYMKSPEWTKMIDELKIQPEVIEIGKFLNESGVHLHEYGKKLCGFIHDVKVETDHPVRSLKAFIADVKQIIPLAKLIQMFDDKMNNSPAFKELYEKITSEKAHMLVNNVRALPMFEKIVEELRIMGVDIDHVFKIVYAVFGWTEEIPPKPK